MTSFAKFSTEREAIKAARQAARDESENKGGEPAEAVVILNCGDSLIFRAARGKLTTRREPGWFTDGTLFCGPRAYAVAW